MNNTRTEWGVSCRDHNGDEWVEDGGDHAIWGRERAEMEIELIDESTTVVATLVRRTVLVGAWEAVDE